MLLGTLTDGAYALGAGTARSLRGRPRFLAGERWVSGSVYIGLGVVAAVSSRRGAPPRRGTRDRLRQGEAMSHLRDKYCIVGVGETEYSRGSGRSTRAMAVEAIRKAILDAGLKASDVDGMLDYQGGDSTLAPPWRPISASA